jgi:hypothetical protein
VLLAAVATVLGLVARPQWSIRWRGLGSLAVHEGENDEKEKGGVELRIEVVLAFVLLFLGMRKLVEF